MSTFQVTKLQEVGILISESSTRQRDAALDVAGMVRDITNSIQAQIAKDALDELKSIARQVETSRKDVKGPVTDLGRRIDGAASQFVASVEEEAKRIQMLLDRFVRDEQIKRQEQERKAREEQARIEQEHMKRMMENQRAEQAKIDEARRLRYQAQAEIDQTKRAELVKKADAAGLEAYAILKHSRAETAEVSQKLIKSQQVAVASAVPDTIKVREVWDYEITDIRQAFASLPYCFEITPKRRNILAAIESGTRECNGMKIFQRTEAR